MTDATAGQAVDLLYGMKAIADHLAPLTYRQVQHLHETKAIPTFRIGSTVCARRSTLAEHFAAQEAAAREMPRAPKLIDPGSATVLRGIRAIASHIGTGNRETAHLDRARRLPTFHLDDGTLVATTAALDDYLALKETK